ncbi:hypothetical protein ACFXTO_006601 [Malus domestica]
MESSYTWTDNKEDEVRCRLDRVFVSQPWLKLFPVTRVFHLSPSKWDHLPIMVEIQSSVESSSRRKSKRFDLRRCGFKRIVVKGLLSRHGNEVFGSTKVEIAKDSRVGIEGTVVGYFLNIFRSQGVLDHAV